MSSVTFGLIDKKGTLSADLLDIAGDARQRLPKWYSDDLDVSLHLLRALKNVNLAGVPNVFLLDCSRKRYVMRFNSLARWRM
ncbi:hypothetical protein K435DRAFT_881482 [Dendrothele bispora CBS 962.96]|uniref:Uncharacterized protein n=1 Tax=Dendrothele bispora (strain CBS 962.96) TaxID=1314807 RepID=A0A4S8KIC9_DENBC|nr:hypothetical protein K435DRAFT_881482 [Dendrothele bispora CBS 962.96]